MPQTIPLLTLMLICTWYEEPPPKVTPLATYKNMIFIIKVKILMFMEWSFYDLPIMLII